MLPTLESALKHGTLVEMAKEMDLYDAYLDLIEIISENPTLSPILLDIGEDYEPLQKESLATLIANLAQRC